MVGLLMAEAGPSQQLLAVALGDMAVHGCGLTLLFTRRQRFQAEWLPMAGGGDFCIRLALSHSSLTFCVPPRVDWLPPVGCRPCTP